MPEPFLKDAEAIKFSSAAGSSEESNTVAKAVNDDSSSHQVKVATGGTVRSPRERNWLRRFHLDYLLGAVSTFALVGAFYFHLGPFAPPAIDFHPYIVILQDKIRGRWKPNSHSASKIPIHFKIHKNGELSDIGFDRMSRLSEADAAALKAIIASMPALGPLPTGSPETVDIQFDFYNHVIRRSFEGFSQSQIR